MKPQFFFSLLPSSPSARSTLTQGLKLEEPAQLIGEHPQVVVVEEQLAQVDHVAQLGRQVAQFVGGEIEVHEVLHLGDVRR